MRCSAGPPPPAVSIRRASVDSWNLPEPRDPSSLQAPAQDILPARAGEAEADLRDRSEAAAPGREAVADPCLQPAVPQVAMIARP